MPSHGSFFQPLLQPRSLLAAVLLSTTLDYLLSLSPAETDPSPLPRLVGGCEAADLLQAPAQPPACESQGWSRLGWKEDDRTGSAYCTWLCG